MSYELKSTYGSLPRTTRGKALIISGDPKGRFFLYTNGKNVYMRDIKDPSYTEIYSEHSVNTTVARYAPSGFYIASADVSGKIRIWDTTQKEHILKNQFQPLGGCINDLDYTGDSQRIVVGGEGREKMGHVFSADTGTSVGEISGQSKSLNAVAMRPQRPFRAATASEDNTVAFFHGPPFKFQFCSQHHSRFVNAVRYAPSGDHFVSGGADGKVILYDGKTGEKTLEFGDPAHKGGIYGVYFSPDSKKVVSVSADKTAKIWNVHDGSLDGEHKFGNGDMLDMQVGCLWQRDIILSVSLAGFITYLNPDDLSTPSRVIKGHNKPVTSVAVQGDTLYTGSSDGSVCHWNMTSGENDMVTGKGHSNQVQSIKINGDNMITCSMDDTLMFSSSVDKSYGSSLKMPSQPQNMSINKDGQFIYVACINHLVCVSECKIVSTVALNYEASCISASESTVAVGSSADDLVRLYTCSNGQLTAGRELKVTAAATDVQFSPDGEYLAVSDEAKKICLFKLPDYEQLTKTEWAHHTAKIKALSWSPNSKYIASASLDTNVFIWSVENRSKLIKIKGAHPMSQVNGVIWSDDNTVISIGQDSCVRKWTINHH